VKINGEKELRESEQVRERDKEEVGRPNLMAGTPLHAHFIRKEHMAEP